MVKIQREVCKWIDPAIIAQELTLSFGEEGLIWLDGDNSKNGRWVTLAIDPIEQICSRGLPYDISNSNPFHLLRNLSPGHWTGWLSYEAGAWLEPSNPWRRNEMAILWIARHDPVLKFDLKQQKMWIEGHDQKRLQSMSHWIKTIEANNIYKNLSQSNPPSIPLNSWKWLTNKNEYAEKVDVIKDWIKKGDIFQANLSTSCISSSPFKKNKLDFFLKLRKECPSPFSGIVIGNGKASGEAVISTSPERFLKVSSDGHVETRPIKGTMPRHQNALKDVEMAANLICSPKDRAENIMIVDLLRNDLGKVCKPGTIHISELLSLESYSKVHHLTSVIKGHLEDKKTWVDLLEACWPGGSISGAPKIRACQRLYELEGSARGAYCGSFLHLDWNGKFDSNILIRSLMINKSLLKIHAGCGIVADSDPKQEAKEMSWKLMPLLKALE